VKPRIGEEVYKTARGTNQLIRREKKTILDLLQIEESRKKYLAHAGEERRGKKKKS